MERLTVNLTDRAADALRATALLTGDNKTDTVNRALSVYAYMEELRAAGGSLLVRDAAGEIRELVVF